MLAHVPDINDFVAGFREVLAPGGTVTVEFPHLLQLVRQGQFDTIYHEHFSYLSLRTVQRIFAAQGLAVWDVETLPTHGGSLRVWAQHAAEPAAGRGRGSRRLLHEEDAAGMRHPAFYRGLQARADRIKNDLLVFLIEQKRAGKTVAAYGAAAKGNTLLNYAGIRRDLLPFVVDASPHKQGRFLPGSRIPVVAEDAAAPDPARLRADPAVEPARRDRGAACLRPRLGRPAGDGGAGPAHRLKARAGRLSRRFSGPSTAPRCLE